MERGEPLHAAAAPSFRGVFHFDAPDEVRWPTELGFDAAGASVSDDDLRNRVKSVSPDSTALIDLLLRYYRTAEGVDAQPSDRHDCGR